MSDAEQNPFEEWAIVDQMGHIRLVGRVSEQVIAGRGFVRIDVPATKAAPKFTKFIGPDSIFAIQPVSEEIAREMAESRQDVPISAYELNRSRQSQGRLPFVDTDDEGNWADDHSEL